jgi:Helitron helicase-like domain at N-terminus
VPTQTVKMLKATALKHWNNKGGVLSVSHSAAAQSIYNNPNLYPQMFPWLFPYGLGGIGTTNLSDKLHKHALLMYHDKRFQLDLIFLFVAFSHEQVKLSTSAGFLLAETSKFSQIANRLLNINQDALANISAWMAHGEVVKPASEEEAAYFQLINDLDHINGKVDGSTTSKKYMRSKIWSLIAYMGAPLWYIMLSPTDNKHPLGLYFADGKEHFDINLLWT